VNTTKFNKLKDQFGVTHHPKDKISGRYFTQKNFEDLNWTVLTPEGALTRMVSESETETGPVIC